MASLRFLPVLGLAFGSAFAAPAFAQYAPVQPAEAEVAAARNCLCLEQAVESRKFELDVRNGIFEKARADMLAVEAEVAQRRPAVNVDDSNQVDAFRSLLARADAARAHYEFTAVPDQQRAVGEYNAVVEQLNASCKGRSFSTYAWTAARQNLTCPRN
ncbi:MAG: hypothetical protein JNM30_14900 [Rhodospirillales bacterium]|nr:hypothetical protein [Rhodospirillales bacterium]